METLYIALCAFLGFFMYALLEYQSKKTKSRFSFIHWLSDNWVKFTLALISTVALLLFGTEILDFFHIQYEGDGFPRLMAFTSGLLNYMIIRRITKAFKKKLN